MKRNSQVRKFVAYYRVSTAKQGASGLGLEAQRSAVQEYLAGHRANLIAEFTEIESGTKGDRAALTAALEACHLYGATLIIAKLDRLARNVAFTSNLMESGVEFIAVDNPTASRLTIHILAAVAEDEAARISARTKAALSAARARGIVLGGRKTSAKRFSEIASLGRQASARSRAARSHRRADSLRSTLSAILASGATSLRAIATRLNESGIPTVRGGSWSAAQVSRVLKVAA